MLLILLLLPIQAATMDFDIDQMRQGLSSEDSAVSGSALKSMKLFVTTLLEVCQAQRRLHTGRLALAVDGVQEGGSGGSRGVKQRSPTPTPAAGDTATPMVCRTLHGAYTHIMLLCQSNAKAVPRWSIFLLDECLRGLGVDTEYVQDTGTTIKFLGLLASLRLSYELLFSRCKSAVCSHRAIIFCTLGVGVEGDDGCKS